MLILAGMAVCIARTIEHSKLGYGLAAIRDDELAAETSGVPTLKLKLIATVLSGALMGMAGAPLPYYITYLDPSSAFNLSLPSTASPCRLVGGTANWIGPVLGAVFLATVQQVATVTISSALNLLFVGVHPGGLRGDRAQRHHRLVQARQAAEARLMEALLRVENLGKRFGGFVALEWHRPRRGAGERLGLIGPNGSGKSTLVNCISGTLRNETGTVQFANRKMDGLAPHQRTRLGLARSFQLPKPFRSMTVAENLHVPLLYTVNARPEAHLSNAAIDRRARGAAAPGRARRESRPAGRAT